MSKLGEVKLQTENGTVTLPVFEESDIGPDVYDVIRVMTENGAGVIPFTDKEEASFNFLRIKTENNGIIAAHNTNSLGPQTRVLEDFEDNPSSNWTVWDSSLSLTSRSYEGSQAVYFGGVGDGTSLAEKVVESGGKKIEWISFWYWERSDGTGHGIRLKNSNGNYEVGAMTDNPQFSFDDSSGPHQLGEGNPSYSTWTKCKLSFNWETNEVTVEFSNNSSGTETGSLKQGKDIEKVELWTYSGPVDSRGWGSDVHDQTNHWDYIRYRG